MNLEQLNVEELSSEELVKTTGGRQTPWYLWAVDIEMRYTYSAFYDAMFIGT